MNQNCETCPIGGAKCNLCKQGVSQSLCQSHCTNCKRCGSDGKCDYCLQKYWGTDCSKACPANCLVCSMGNGACKRCIDGHWGETCTAICPWNNCVDCNNRSGILLCERCKDGFWGLNCEYKCYSGCAETYCYKNAGVCPLCKHSYWGLSCNMTCSIDNCGSLIGCSKKTGPSCYMCINGKWGEQCSKKCPINCPNDCETITGECKSTSKYSSVNPQATINTALIGESTDTQSVSAVSETKLETTYSLPNVILSDKTQPTYSSWSILESSSATPETINTRIIPVSADTQNTRISSSNPMTQIPNEANLNLVLGLSIGSALVTSLIITIAPHLFKSLFMSGKSQLSKVNKDTSKGPVMSSVFALSDNANTRVADDDSFTTTKERTRARSEEQSVNKAKDDSVRQYKGNKGEGNYLRKSVYHR